MLIGGVQKTSLLDYPDKISAIIFTTGCNFRCDYCHNPELINSSKTPAWTCAGVLEFLSTRKAKLDGVVITGGEPCIQVGLLDFIKQIKSMGFLVKLDTNGTSPNVLKELMPFIDYIAMDIKAPLYKYSNIVNIDVDVKKIKKSIELIINSGIDYEFRTTVVKSQLSMVDLINIGKLISGAKKYYLQKFVPSKLLNETFLNEKTYSDEEFKEIINKLSIYINNIYIR